MNPNDISVWTTRIIQNIVEVNITEKRNVGPEALGLGPAKIGQASGENRFWERPISQINCKRSAQSFRGVF